MIVRTYHLRNIPVYLGIGWRGITLAWWSRRKGDFRIFTIGEAQIWK